MVDMQLRCFPSYDSWIPVVLLVPIWMFCLCLCQGLWGLNVFFGLRPVHLSCGSADVALFVKIYRLDGVVGFELLSFTDFWRVCGALGVLSQFLDQSRATSFVPQLESGLEGTAQLP